MTNEKKQRKKRTSPNEGLSEEQKTEIAEYQDKIRAIRQTGRFASFYTIMRKELVDIKKSDGSELEKKQAILDMCERVTREINEAM